jgi:hypothetical protein
MQALIRPTINALNSPYYNLGKCICKYIDQIVDLPSFNVKKYIRLINDLSQLEVDAHSRLCSFDISNI